MNLWIWNWIGGGYNSCLASSREEALKNAATIAGKTTLRVDENTLRIGSNRELESINRSYALD